MKATNYLLAAILAVLLLQFQPELARTAVVLAGAIGAAYACYWLIARFPDKRRQAKAQRDQEERDEPAFWEYTVKHDAIRSKFDPKGTWNEATEVPSEYTAQVRQLNLEYRSMLQRRNGWSARDFDEE